MSINCSISTFDISRFNALTALFSENVAPNDRLLSRTYSEWLCVNNPFGPAKIITAAQDGSWLGFIALVRVCLGRQKEVRIGYFVDNVLVQRKQRGNNIFGMMIQKAIEYVKTERAMLVGHQNSLAYRAWQRAEMQFQRPLKPYVFIPAFFRPNVDFYDVTNASQIGTFMDTFSE
jgi:GNAT superfamily N-acetyltransferase